MFFFFISITSSRFAMISLVTKTLLQPEKFKVTTRNLGMGIFHDINSLTFVSQCC